jgi:MFS family permease
VGNVGPQVLLLSASMVVAFVAIGTYMPLVPMLGLSLGASPSAVGLLVSAAYGLPLFLAMPVGSLVDRVGARVPVLAGLAGLMLAPGLLAVQPSLAALAVAQVLFGVSHLVVVIAAQRFVATAGSRKSVERDFGLYTMAVSAGQFVGPLVGGLLVDMAGFRAAHGLAAACSLLALLIAATLRNQSTGARPRARVPVSKEHVFAQLRNPGVRVAIVASSAVIVGMAALQTFLPIQVLAMGYSATAVGVLFSIKSGAGMAIRTVMPLVVRMAGRRSRLLLVCVIVVGAGTAIIGFASTFTTMAVISLLVGLASGVSQPLSMVAVIDHVASSYQGHALGLRMAANRAVQLLTPSSLGLIAEAASITAAFVVAALLVCVLGAILAIARPRFDEAEDINRSLPT